MAVEVHVRMSRGRALRLVVLIVGLALIGGLYAGRFALLGKIAGVRPPTGAPGSVVLTLPDGFTESVFASGLRGPRFMTVGPDGTLFVAERDRGRVVALPDDDEDGRADSVLEIAARLDAPSSLAFRPDTHELYIGETSRVSRVDLAADGRTAVRVEAVLPGLPTGGHSTRTVLFGPDGNLYVSVGSSCNVCQEEDPRRAAVLVVEPDGSNPRVFAAGLRNAVGLAVNPATGSLWASNNGRDLMGNDLPPETLYVLRAGMDAGWPRCHAGDIPDPGWEGDGACDGVAMPALTMQAHSAPLGIAFYDSPMFGPEYQGGLFVAFHGSWNRDPPTGYKVVFVKLDGDRAVGPPEDFATGWLRPDGEVPGRPAGVTVARDGALLVSDDKAGLIYRIVRP